MDLSIVTDVNNGMNIYQYPDTAGEVIKGYTYYSDASEKKCTVTKKNNVIASYEYDNNSNISKTEYGVFGYRTKMV